MPVAGARRRQRGVALLIALLLITLVTAVVSDFQYSSQVDVELAYHARDELQAEYNALSALRFRALILKQARTLQNLVKVMAGATGGGKPPPIASIMELIPVECGLLSQLMRSGGFESDANEDFFPGECMASSESEHAKIPINLLGNPQAGGAVALMLLGVLRDPRLKHLFEQDDGSGQHADSPVALVTDLANWINPDHSAQGNLGDKDRFYQAADPPYRSKNARFDTVAEMQLVHGVGDTLYDVLRDRVSVYSSSQQIELATAPLTTVLSTLQGTLVSPEALDTYLNAQAALAARLTMLRALGPLVPLSTAMLKAALADLGIMGLFDAGKLTNIFSDDSSSTWYTIKAQGQVGHASRRLRVVFQADEGTFYYARME